MICCRVLPSPGARGQPSSLLRVEREVGSNTGVRQDTGYSTESSESRRSRPNRVISLTHITCYIFCFTLKNPFVSGSKSYSTSTGGEMRELEDLSEIPSEYRELGDDSDSESDYR